MHSIAKWLLASVQITFSLFTCHWFQFSIPITVKKRKKQLTLEVTYSQSSLEKILKRPIWQRMCNRQWLFWNFLHHRKAFLLFSYCRSKVTLQPSSVNWQIVQIVWWLFSRVWIVLIRSIHKILRMHFFEIIQLSCSICS